MNSEQPNPITLVLSRDELLAVLGVLEADSIPGLDVEPGAPRSEQEQALARETALRSLRARGIAAQNGDGKLHFHNDLLTAVGACAYPQSALFALHWAQAADAPMRFFGNRLDETYVVHTRPEALLHHFVTLPTKERLFHALFAFCQLDTAAVATNSGKEDTPAEFALPAAEFALVRQLSEQGEVEAAAARLESVRIDAAVANTFATAFTHSPRLTVLQTVKQSDVGKVIKRDFMLVQTPEQLWFVGAVDGEAVETELRIKRVSLDEVKHLLDEWL